MIAPRVRRSRQAQCDRELRGSRSGQQIRRGDRPLELLFGQPLALHNTKLAKQRDVCGRATEADATDPAPFARDRAQ